MVQSYTRIDNNPIIEYRQPINNNNDSLNYRRKIQLGIFTLQVLIQFRYYAEQARK